MSKKALAEQSVFLCQSDDGDQLMVDQNHRSDPQVQTHIKAMMVKHPGAKLRIVGLDEISAAQQRSAKSKESKHDAKKAELADMTASESQLLMYFKKGNELNASDIHFLVADDIFTVRMRIYGELVDVDTLSSERGMAMLSTTIQTLCDAVEVMFNPMREQDARLKKEFMRQADLFGARYSHRPTPNGLYAVCRLIKDDADKVPTLEELGFLPEQQKLIKTMYGRPEGLILLTGPTGSGKSTTLRSVCRAMQDQHKGKRSLLTLEDPVEGAIIGAIQTAIMADKSDTEAVKHAWHRALSSAMRLDPDAIMEGEIRDIDSVNASIYAAQTGHLLLSTLHTTSALGIIKRMTMMGASLELIADAYLMIGMVSQRLIPELCPHCKIPYAVKKSELEAEDIELLDIFCDESCPKESLFFRNEEGCKQCERKIEINGQVRERVSLGLKGRMVIGEVIAPDSRLFRHYLKGGEPAARHYWLNSLSGISRVQHLRVRCAEGRADPLLAHSSIPLDEDHRFAIGEEEI